MNSKLQLIMDSTDKADNVTDKKRWLNSQNEISRKSIGQIIIKSESQFKSSDQETFELMDYIVYGWAFWMFISNMFFGPIVRHFIAKRLLMAELGHNMFIMLK
jgi:hypothetical protein